MAEYIEREAAIKARNRSCKRNCAECDFAIEGDSWCEGEVFVVDLLRIPAADVAPVRHGRWVKTVGENGVTSAYRCSGCGFEDNRYTLFNFCPNCGAAMNKDGDGDV